jgi:fumarate reductase subunit C
MNVRLYVWQRATAALMVPLVVVHVALIFYAMGRGLTAADILGRTRGSVTWACFYGLFVLTVSIHASIGTRNIVTEWSPMSESKAGWLAALFGVFLLILGLRAVAAVVLP